uniref:Uncharacterized protein n=1 Tax=Corethron hystrix TaxID=216773 RepID=A0A6U5HQM2_9STRA|mmetsp:Transcript_31236/g.71423  ORF Transcript_31236/g.71423 Transcript_31236/m.71423 type:complete len:272 (+) Transcript_31236:1850-2665(+)
MPHANVLDLSVFPAISRRHCVIARKRGGLHVRIAEKVITRDSDNSFLAGEKGEKELSCGITADFHDTLWGIRRKDGKKIAPPPPVNLPTINPFGAAEDTRDDDVEEREAKGVEVVEAGRGRGGRGHGHGGRGRGHGGRGRGRGHGHGGRGRRRGGSVEGAGAEHGCKGQGHGHGSGGRGRGRRRGGRGSGTGEGAGAEHGAEEDGRGREGRGWGRGRGQGGQGLGRGGSEQIRGAEADVLTAPVNIQPPEEEMARRRARAYAHAMGIPYQG